MGIRLGHHRASENQGSGILPAWRQSIVGDIALGKKLHKKMQRVEYRKRFSSHGQSTAMKNKRKSRKK